MSHRTDALFAWVWRINAVLILLAGSLGVVIALLLATELGGVWNRESPEDHVQRVADADIAGKNLRLGEFTQIAGTSQLVAELGAPPEYRSSRSGPRQRFARNLLFFDTSTKKSRWLLADNGNMIPRYFFVTDPPSRYRYDDRDPDRRAQVTLSIVFELQPGDPNHEPQQESSPHEIAAAAPDGTSITTLVKSAESVLGWHLVDRGSLLLFYVGNGAVRVLDLDPVSRNVRSDAPLTAAK